MAHGVHQGLNADVLASGTAQDGLNEPGQRLAANDFVQRCGRNFAPFEIGAGDKVLVVMAGQNLEEMIAPFACRFALIGGNLFGAKFFSFRAFVDRRWPSSARDR